MRPRKFLAIGLATVSSVVAADDAAQSSAYDQIIAPIFQARCVACHGTKKQKAKLALHSWDALLKGSDGGPVLVAGKPTESTLLERLRLPLTDEEHMPPSDEPQPSAEEISLIERWLEKGASRTATVAELQLPAPLAKAATELPAKLAAIPRASTPSEPPWEFDEAAVTKLRSPLAATVAKLQQRFPGAMTYESRTSPDLHFTAVGFGKEFGDAALAELSPLRQRIVVLDIAATGVTDASAPILSGFTRLRVLRAGFTSLGDAAAARISTIESLESLSLPSTSVTAASISAWSKLRRLRALRVAGTSAEQPAREANLPVSSSAADPARFR